MPYNPGQSYQGANFMFQGLNALGAGIGDAFSDFAQEYDKKKKEREEKEKELAFNDSVIQHAIKTKRLDPNSEEYQKYLTGNDKQKMGIAHGIIQNIAEDQQQKQQQQMTDYRKAEMQRAAAQADYYKSLATTASQPQVTTVPGKDGPIQFYRTPKGWARVPSGPQSKAPKPPKLGADEQKILGWATNRLPAEDNIAAKLPDDLKKAAQWAQDNPKDPRAVPTWNKIKAEVIKRYTTPDVQQGPEDTEE